MRSNPINQSMRDLQRNIDLNHNPSNLEIFPFALSNFSGSTMLYTASPEDFNQGVACIMWS